MNEWVIQTYGDQGIVKQPGTWRTWCDEIDTSKQMPPMDLTSAVERARLYMEMSREGKDSVLWRLMQRARFRIFNIKTGEEIPLEALGL